MKNPAVFVFDCDGVLLESVGVKTQAFATLFGDYPAHCDAIVQYHIKNGGLSRHVKIRHILSVILGEAADETRVAELSERFGSLVADGVRSCHIVPGTLRLLDQIAAYPLFVISGTPHDELHDVLHARGLLDKFDQVFGSPLSKTDALNRIVRITQCAPGDILFVGDSETDADAATRVGTEFVARVTEDDQVESSPGWPRVRDMDELAFLLEALT